MSNIGDNLQAWRVLAVDDNHAHAEMVKYGLHMRGIQVDVAYSADQAVNKIITFDPNILLLDIAMPMLSGIDLLQTLQARGLRRADLIVIAMTAIDVQLMQESGPYSGTFHGLIRKPFRLGEVVNQMREIATYAHKQPLLNIMAHML
jgi:DNA-binding response OmpR family regulator